MNPVTIEEMTMILGALRYMYPGGYFQGDDVGGMAKFWAVKLRDYPASTVKAAMNRAIDAYPEKIPSLGQFRALVRDEAKSEAARRAVPRAEMDSSRLLGEDEIEMSTMTREESRQKLRDIMKEAGLA